MLALMPFHPKENGGLFGRGNGTLSFVNIDNTIDMVSRSSVLFCIHRSAIWIHLNTYLTHESLIARSISSSPSPACHKSHA